MNITEEEEFVTAIPIFSHVRQWLDKVEKRKLARGGEVDYVYEYMNQLETDICVEVGQDGLSGKIVFQGIGESASHWYIFFNVQSRPFCVIKFCFATFSIF